MSSNGEYLGDGPSWLSYEDKLCPKCGDLTTIKVSHSFKNPNKLYHWCDTHTFVGWCLPTNDEISHEGIAQTTWNKGLNYLKVCLKNRDGKFTALCYGNNTLAMVLVAFVVLAFVVKSVIYR